MFYLTKLGAVKIDGRDGSNVGRVNKMNYDVREGLKKIMASYKPNSSEYRKNWMLYQTLYDIDPDKFQIISGLHQNHISDPLHFSIQVNLRQGLYHRLHFNFYFFNKMVLKNITRTREDNTAEIIAEF